MVAVASFQVEFSRFVGPDGKLDIAKIQPIARMGYFDYAVIRETFEMRIPGATGAEAAGLEGKV